MTDYLISFSILLILAYFIIRYDILKHLVYNNERQVYITSLNDIKLCRDFLFALSETSKDLDRKEIADDLIATSDWTDEDHFEAKRILIEEYDCNLNE